MTRGPRGPPISVYAPVLGAVLLIVGCIGTLIYPLLGIPIVVVSVLILVLTLEMGSSGPRPTESGGAHSAVHYVPPTILQYPQAESGRGSGRVVCPRCEAVVEDAGLYCPSCGAPMR